MEQDEFMKWWNKYGNFVAGISIIIFVVFAWTMVIKDHNLKLEINENCGWGEEDYRCYCEKSESMAIYNRLESIINWSPEDD